MKVKLENVIRKEEERNKFIQFNITSLVLCRVKGRALINKG